MAHQPTPSAQPSTIAAVPLLSCADIAAILKRNVVSVFRCIQREGIEPAITTPGGFKFFSEESVELIRNAMRAPNASK